MLFFYTFNFYVVLILVNIMLTSLTLTQSFASEKMKEFHNNQHAKTKWRAVKVSSIFCIVSICLIIVVIGLIFKSWNETIAFVAIFTIITIPISYSKLDTVNIKNNTKNARIWFTFVFSIICPLLIWMFSSNHYYNKRNTNSVVWNKIISNIFEHRAIIDYYGIGQTIEDNDSIQHSIGQTDITEDILAVFKITPANMKKLIKLNLKTKILGQIRKDMQKEYETWVPKLPEPQLQQEGRMDEDNYYLTFDKIIRSRHTLESEFVFIFRVVKQNYHLNTLCDEKEIPYDDPSDRPEYALFMRSEELSDDEIEIETDTEQQSIFE